MPTRPDHSSTHRADLPTVDRPSFRIWQPLEAESIQWEGQVLIVGGVTDMPALLAVTSQRLALIANGQIMLDFPRSWLRPQPKLAAENGIRLYINPEGVEGDAHPVLLRAREGRGAAMELVAALTGRPLPIEAPTNGVRIPNWKATVGASRAVALPSLGDDAAEAATRSQMTPAWPPQESAGVSARPSQAVAQAPTPARSTGERPMQSLADRRRAMPEPTPVPASVSRAARKQGTHEDGVTVRDDGAWQDAHFTTTPRRRRAAGPWLATAAMVLLLAFGFGYVAHDRHGWTIDDVLDRIPANVQESLGFGSSGDEDIALNPAPDVLDTKGGIGDGTDGNGNGVASQPDAEPEGAEPDGAPVVEATEEPAEEPVIETAQDVVEPVDPTAGVGGPTSELPAATEEPAGVQEVQDPTAPIETMAPAEVAEPTAVPTEAPTTVPTAEPTAEPTEAATEVPTEEPTVEPTEIATEEPTPEPTVEPTIEPTEEPTAEATEAVTEIPTEEPVDEAEPTVESQEPSVLPETTPEQAVVSEGFRYTIEGASIGAKVPEVPEINSVAGYGQWVVLNVYAQNMSGERQVFEMSDFLLYADGREVELDSGTAWVNGLLGNVPAYGATDAILWAPGESHLVTLVFLAPADAGSLVLQAGDQMIDISPALADPAPLRSEGPRVESQLLQGTVVDVIDGETVVVEIDGVQQAVRYLSLDVPTGDACYASEATEANRALVAGQTVIIERQSADVDARGNWVRDVWVTNEDGQPVLVSQQLVAQGAAEVKVSHPNTRFAGWLQQTQAEAQAEGAGLWGACGE
jgi:endonuclease YncB( thermonuclease family)